MKIQKSTLTELAKAIILKVLPCAHTRVKNSDLNKIRRVMAAPPTEGGGEVGSVYLLVAVAVVVIVGE
jgi:hypothetical protein